MTPQHVTRSNKKTRVGRTLLLCAMATLALLGAACGDDDDGASGSEGTTAGSGPSTTGGDSAEPQRGGRLVVAVDAEAEGFDPALSNFSTTGYTYATAVFDPLMATNTDGEIVPYLAESMEPNDDHTQWTMTLRPGITFHDGTPFNAEAVKANIDHHLGAPAGAAYTGLGGVTVVDDLTLTFDLDQPWVAFPFYLTADLGLMAAPSMLADPDGASQPVGTGPFVFEEWIPNQHFVATRNPDYWQEGLPYLDEIEFRPIPEFQSRLNALQTGEIDVMYGYGGESLSAAQDAGGGIQVQTIDNGAFLEKMTLFNNIAPPFDNIHARRAVAFATNVEQLNDVLERGLEEPATGPFSGQDDYPEPDNLPTFDPDQAADELAAYAEDTGEAELSFELLATSTAAGLQRAELLQDMWQQAGMNVDIRQIEESQLIVSVLQGDFQATPWQFDGFFDPDRQTIFWSSFTAAPVGEFGPNFGRFRNDQVDALMAEARGAADPDERRDLYAQVAQIIVDEVPWAYTTRSVSMLAAGPNVSGLGSFPVPGGGDAMEYLAGVVRVSSLSRVE